MQEPNKFQIIFDVKSLELSNKGSITGILYFDFGDFQFPGIGWSDFVVVILGWWLDQITCFANEKASTKLQFMDGPVHISLSIDFATKLWRLDCIRDEYRNVVYSQLINCDHLLDNVKTIAKQVIRECQNNGWSNKDIEILSSKIK